jgi:predicted PurR-regulated permease PerM
MNAINFSYYIKIVLTLLLGWFLFNYFSDVISWIVIAWVLSLMGKPVMKWLTKVKIGKYRLPNAARVVMTIAFFYLLIGALLSIVMPPVITQAKQLSKVDVNKVQKSLEVPIGKFNEKLEKWGFISSSNQEINHTSQINDNQSLPSQQVTVNIDSLFVKNSDSIQSKNLVLNINIPQPNTTDAFGNSANNHSEDKMEKLHQKLLAFVSPESISSAIGGIFGMLGNLFVAFASITFITFFFLNDTRLFEKILLALVPDRSEKDTRDVIDRIEEMLPRYFRGILLEMGILMAYLWLALTIFGIENALLIAFFGALLNIVPYLGPFLGAAFGLFITLCSNIELDFYQHTMNDLIFVSIIFITSQWLDNFLLQPIIFSKSVKAHPLEIFLVIIVAAKLFGIMGMVVAVPVYTTLRIIAAEFFSHIKWVSRLAGHLNEEEE